MYHKIGIIEQGLFQDLSIDSSYSQPIKELNALIERYMKFFVKKHISSSEVLQAKYPYSSLSPYKLIAIPKDQESYQSITDSIHEFLSQNSIVFHQNHKEKNIQSMIGLLFVLYSAVSKPSEINTVGLFLKNKNIFKGKNIVEPLQKVLEKKGFYQFQIPEDSWKQAKNSWYIEWQKSLESMTIQQLKNLILQIFKTKRGKDFQNDTLVMILETVQKYRNSLSHDQGDKKLFTSFHTIYEYYSMVKILLFALAEAEKESS